MKIRELFPSKLFKSGQKFTRKNPESAFKGIEELVLIRYDKTWGLFNVDAGRMLTSLVLFDSPTDEGLSHSLLCQLCDNPHLLSMPGGQLARDYGNYPLKPIRARTRLRNGTKIYSIITMPIRTESSFITHAALLNLGTYHIDDYTSIKIANCDNLSFDECQGLGILDFEVCDAKF